MLPPKEFHTHCPRCSAEMPHEERLCHQCGLDRKAYLAAEAIAGPAVATARKWMLALAGFYGAITLLLYEHLHDVVPPGQGLWVFGPGFGLAAVFMACWLWSKYQPFLAALVALALFSAVQALNVVQDPGIVLNLYSLALRAAVLVGLFIGTQRAYKAFKIRQAYRQELGGG